MVRHRLSENLSISPLVAYTTALIVLKYDGAAKNPKSVITAKMCVSSEALALSMNN